MRPASDANTLQEQCVNCVVKSFGQLIDIKNSGSGIIPQKYFEFLQRMYSKVILEKLAIQDSLKDKYLTFLINPYLKELDLRSSTFADPTIVIERLKAVGNSITHLDLREKYYSEDVIIEIVTLVPCVEELYLSQTESSDRVLKAVGKNCTQIRVLDMGLCNITIEGLRSLCVKNENSDFKPNLLLKKLHIGSTSVTPEGLVFALKNFPNLEVLDHENLARTIYKDHKQQFLTGFLQDQPKYKLTKLDLFHISVHFSFGFSSDNNEQCDITEVLMVCAMLCPNVTSLSADNLSSPSAVLACSNFAQLQDVKLSAAHTSEYTPFLSASGAPLIKLELNCGTVSLDVLVQCCQKLESLVLQAIKMEKLLNPSETTTLPKLTSLIFEGYEFLNDEVEPIIALVSASPKVEVLRFPYCRSITDQFVNSLLACKCMATIRKLDFSFSDLTVNLARKFLCSLPRLEKMIIEDCDVSSSEYDNLLTTANTENLGVELVWRIGSTDYGSDYENDYDLYHYEYPTHDFDYEFDDIGYINYFDDEDDDDDDYDPDEFDSEPFLE